MKVKYWIKHEIRYYPSYLKQGIKNLIKWFRIIWTDRDWDYAYIDYILLFKLKETYKMLNPGHAAPLPNNPEYWKGVKAMRICINILERRKSDFYYNILKHYINGDPKLYTYKLRDNIETRDWKIFCKLFETYHDYWWD